MFLFFLLVFFISIYTELLCAVSRHSKKEIGRCFKLIRQAANPAMTTVSTTDFMVSE